MTPLLRHQCLIYSGAPSAHLPEIGAAIVGKLNAGYRCLYLNSPPMVSGLRSHLAAAGVDLEERIAARALVLSSEQTIQADGRFDIEAMISSLKGLAVQSEADGFTGLWASGDMTWEFGNEKNLEELLRYECRLEKLFQEVPTLCGVCQYHVDTLPSGSVQEALYAHPGVFINEALSRVNPHYLSPELLNSAEQRASSIDLPEMLAELGLPSLGR